MNFDVTLIVPPKDFFADQEVVEIYDAEGLAMVERNKLIALREYIGEAVEIVLASIECALSTENIYDKVELQNEY